MARYFTQKLTVDKLADIIWNSWTKHEDFEEQQEDYEELAKKGKNWAGEERTVGPGLVEKWDSNIPYKHLTKQIEEDLRKVNFDCENISADPKDSNTPGYIGLNTLPNGLTYLGVTAGGDWENPLFFAIYWDGAKLRGYIPESGNPWNTDTKRAYGNDEDSDEKNLRKRGYSSRDDAQFDFSKISEDMQNRIQYKE